MDIRRAYYWCTGLQMISTVKIRRLIEQTGSPEKIFGLKNRTLAECGFKPGEIKLINETAEKEKQYMDEYEKLESSKIHFISCEEKDYPDRLKEYKDRPLGLFYRGRLPDPEKPSAAVVGARACSSYGRECAEHISSVLAEAGVSVISGMAYGIDSWSQRAALEKGCSYAVLGGGVDICYPRENNDLYDMLIEKCGVISEMRPGTRGLPILFPRRNRIISGISDVIVVAEAREKSGSLITADFAADQGKLVYAVPGSVKSELSRGCHELIRNGAILLQDPWTLLEDMKIDQNCIKRRNHQENAHGKERLTDQEADVYRFVGQEETAIEKLISDTKYPAGSLLGVLLHLELKGYVKKTPGNQFQKTRLLPPEGLYTG